MKSKLSSSDLQKKSRLSTALKYQPSKSLAGAVAATVRRSSLSLRPKPIKRTISSPSPERTGQVALLQPFFSKRQEGLLLYEQGQTAEAVWQWVFLHRVHWGRHAVGAIFALHCLSISKQE